MSDILGAEDHLGDMDFKVTGTRDGITATPVSYTHLAETADIFLIIGTSLNVYPAAGLLNYVPARTPVYLIDPKQVPIASGRKVHVIQKGCLLYTSDTVCHTVDCCFHKSYNKVYWLINRDFHKGGLMDPTN